MCLGVVVLRARDVVLCWMQNPDGLGTCGPKHQPAEDEVCPGADVKVLNSWKRVLAVDLTRLKLVQTPILYLG